MSSQLTTTRPASESVEEIVPQDDNHSKPRREINGKVAQTAQKRLGSSPYVALHSLRCEYHEGILVLRGQVTSYYFKQLAQETVRNLDGVEAIINGLEVTED